MHQSIQAKRCFDRRFATSLWVLLQKPSKKPGKSSKTIKNPSKNHQKPSKTPGKSSKTIKNQKPKENLQKPSKTQGKSSFPRTSKHYSRKRTPAALRSLWHGELLPFAEEVRLQRAPRPDGLAPWEPKTANKSLKSRDLDLEVDVRVNLVQYNIGVFEKTSSNSSCCSCCRSPLSGRRLRLYRLRLEGRSTGGLRSTAAHASLWAAFSDCAWAAFGVWMKRNGWALVTFGAQKARQAAWCLTRVVLLDVLGRNKGGSNRWFRLQLNS